jgi:hypothetical protein
MHPGFDPERRLLVGAGLHGGLQRLARLAVDRARVAAGVGEALLQHSDLLTAHRGEIASECRGTPGHQSQPHRRRNCLYSE